jgi:hypothetical protein
MNRQGWEGTETRANECPSPQTLEKDEPQMGNTTAPWMQLFLLLS